ncbi:MAG: glutamine synthetase family protein [Desulfitobacteriaceae bacterium]|nr:glutamine synthetase family protein [Desulfitobacteriaceae bacterium]MDI6913418.1 glutamine synthetase family protein [Desulfitobacteriaceae bacterium]
MGKAAEEGPAGLKQLQTWVAEGVIDTCIVAIVDMQGRLMGKRMPAQFFLEHAAHEGSHFCNYLLGTEMDMSTPGGFHLMNWELGYGDWVAVPDFSTLRVLPWQEKTALILADAAFHDGTPVPVSPRQILQAQLAKAGKMGYKVMAAAELELYLMKDDYETAHRKHFHDLEPYGWYIEDYHILQAFKGESVFRQMRNDLTTAGVPIESTKGEAGVGQHEINILYSDALEAADRAVILKHGSKEIAMKQGYSVTFMAKPDHRWTGSSGHLHLSLWDEAGNKNLFWGGGDPHNMSDTMRWFLGGLMSQAADLSVFFAPNVNSYKRYAVASWAPVNVAWGMDNRTCGFRIVGGGSSLRIEDRLPGADINAYLAFAAAIGAGLYGIEKRIEPGQEFQGNAYTASGVPKVPRSLKEAMKRLENSEVARKIFGDDVVQHYINAARVEQELYESVVTCWERERYYERG